MIVDTSVLLAILRSEPEAATFEALILSAADVKMSTASYVEAGLVLAGKPFEHRLDGLIENLGIVLEPVTVEQARAARDAARRFGKGRHPVSLNFGDCFSYALAKVTGEPLLFKGDDFSRTDIRIAPFPA